MNVKVFETKEVQDLLKVASNLDGKDGNARFQQVLHRLLSDLFRPSTISTSRPMKCGPASTT